IPPLPENKTVVVLPFNVTGADASAYYWNGLRESLTATLNQLAPRVQVFPASNYLAGTVSDVNEAGTQLRANLALGVSIESATNLRIVLTLSDTKTRRSRENSIDLVRDDSLVVENRIIDAAVGLLEIELGPQEQRALNFPGTNVPKAYEAYLQGMGYLATH